MLFLPPQPLADWDQYCYYEAAVPADMCEAIITIASTLPLENGVVAGDRGKDEAKDSIRRSRVRWLPVGESTNFIYNLVTKAMLDANGARWRFDLTGFTKPIQFTEYAETGAHYDWHIDLGPGTYSTRKLSFILQLSDPADYEGGNFEIIRPAPDDARRGALRSRGTIIVFPAYTTHRVTPIASGKRYSLVAWMEGPPYR